MTPYYIAYGLMMAISLLHFWRPDSDRQQTKRIVCVLFAMIWVALIGLRHPSMGVDLQYGGSYGYLGRFAYIGQFGWKEVLTGYVQNYERGYIILNKLLSYLGDDPQILLVACAMISIIPIVIWIYRNSEHPLLSFVIYLGLPCFLIVFSGLRQGIALAITTFSLEMVKNKKPIKFLMLVLLAVLFHKHSYVVIFAYPIYHVRMNKVTGILTVFIPLIFYVFRYPLFSILSKLIKRNAVPDNNGAFMLFLVFVAVYFFCVIFGHENDREEQGLRNLFLVACACQALGGVYSTAIRVGYFYMIVLVALLPRIIDNSSRSFRKYKTISAVLMYFVIIVCFGIFGLHSIASTYWAECNPYSFFWQ